MAEAKEPKDDGPQAQPVEPGNPFAGNREGKPSPFAPPAVPDAADAKKTGTKKEG